MDKLIADRAVSDNPPARGSASAGRRDDVPSSLISLMRREQPPAAAPLPADPDGVIFVVGAPRSGTTWLAKILDSHPDVMYRHEPDEVIPSPNDLDATNIDALVGRWVADRSLRTSTKGPFFPKSWQTTPARLLRAAVACGLRGLPLATDFVSRLPIPISAPSIRRGSSSRPSAGAMASASPLGRCPPAGSSSSCGSPARRSFRSCGALAKAGSGCAKAATFRSTRSSAMACAARYGIDRAAFARLPDAAKYAWGWAAFNETVETALSGLPNVRFIRYEDLCEYPQHTAREAMAFAGLTWHAQTADFVRRSAWYAGPSTSTACSRTPRSSAGGGAPK